MYEERCATTLFGEVESKRERKPRGFEKGRTTCFHCDNTKRHLTPLVQGKKNGGGDQKNRCPFGLRLWIGVRPPAGDGRRGQVGKEEARKEGAISWGYV